MERARGARSPSGDKMLDGETVFRLYDTYGFPVDLTADICRERGVTLDMAGFEAAMERAARARARGGQVPRWPRGSSTPAARPSSAATTR